MQLGNEWWPEKESPSSCTHVDSFSSVHKRDNMHELETTLLCESCTVYELVCVPGVTLSVPRILECGSCE